LALSKERSAVASKQTITASQSRKGLDPTVLKPVIGFSHCHGGRAHQSYYQNST
jgi:hypothetical protein